MVMKKTKNGYSLIELAICLALIGIIMGSGLAISNVGNAQSQAITTKAQLDEIEYAIQMFVNRNLRLPCPASLTVAENTSSFGVESTCSGAVPAGVVAINAGTAEEMWVGSIPTRTLGLSDAKMFDAWNGRITYAVPKSYATTGNLIKNASGNNVARLITIRDQNDNQIFPQPTVPTLPFTNPVVYVLVSHGMDYRGAYNNAGALKGSCAAANVQLDIENCDHSDVAGNRDVIFRQMDVRASKIPAQHFHDFVRFKTRIQMGAAALN
jgi:prepilin-type N-terminal cleavage/methylation domain-containing protein